MFAIIAAIAAAIGVLEAFTSLSGISILGLLCVAVACLAVHLVWPVALRR